MIAWILAFFVPFFANPPCQDKKVDKVDKVKVTMVVILASEKGNKVDKQLTEIAEEVRKQNPHLKSFHLKTQLARSLAPLEKGTFELVDDRVAIVVVKSTADDQNRVVLSVKAPGQDEIEYRTVCGKFLPIVTRYHTKSGQRLILAIRVQPCLGD